MAAASVAPVLLSTQLFACGSSTNAAVGRMVFWLFPVSLEGHAAAYMAYQPKKGSERGKREESSVDHEGEEWEGILTESKICFIRGRMKTSTSMFSGSKM